MTAEDTIARAGKTVWWLLLLRGVLLVIFGALTLLWPEIPLVTLVFLFAVFSMADGIGLLVHAFRGGDRRLLLALTGLLSIGTGLVAALWPGLTALVLLVVIAAWALLSGIGEVVAGVQQRKVTASGWGWTVLSGVISIALGVVLAASPAAGLFAVLWLLGVLLLAAGLALVVSAIAFRAAVVRR